MVGFIGANYSFLNIESSKVYCMIKFKGDIIILPSVLITLSFFHIHQFAVTLALMATELNESQGCYLPATMKKVRGHCFIINGKEII